MKVEKSLPKVTVIIPCYNREGYVKQTIDSVLCQTYPNIGVVAVDDGSTESTRQILERYRDRIGLLEHPEHANKGQSAAINLGIKETNGEYIAVLDSDDLWDPEKIRCQVDFLEKNPDVGFVYANGYVINAEGKILSKMFPVEHTESGSPERMLLECPIACPSGFLVRRSCFEKAGLFDESLRSAQDHDMAIRLAEVSKLGYLSDTLWYFRHHSDSQSGKHAKRRWQAGFVILRAACKRYPYSFTVRRRRLAVLHFRLGQCLMEEKSYFRAIARFVLSGFLDPIRALRVILSRERVSSPH